MSKWPLVLVSLVMGIDLLSFSLIVPLVGIGAESNGIMARGYIELGIYGVAALKVACTVAILLLVYRARRNRNLAAGLGILIGAVGVAGNLSALLR